MDRTLISDLLSWQHSSRRKPLLLRGVRQCGKTWLLKEFGRTCYQSMVYVNFDEHPEYAEFFATKNVSRICHNLALATGIPIIPEQTLLILDEIQGCPAALNALKYFHETAPDIHVATAGSLLGVALAGEGFPVGQVDFLNLAPLTFTEFLHAVGESRLVAYASQCDLEPLPEAFLAPLMEQLKAYLITGGMPEPVSAWADHRDLARVEQILAAIVISYELDFAKHAKPTDFPKISLIWRSLPSQLSRENKKFLYQVVKPGARAREYEDALQWLVGADLVAQIYRSRGVGLPISAYDDLSAFKIYLTDVGVLRKLSRLDPISLTDLNRLFTEFRGALTENYVLQSLRSQLEVIPRYWAQNNPPYEVDFLIQHRNEVIPVEVKSGTAVRSPSLTKFQSLFGEQTPLRVRFSGQNLTLDSDLLNIPLCLADQASRLIDLALTRL